MEIKISYKLKDNYVELWHEITAGVQPSFDNECVINADTQKELDEKLKHFNDNYYDYKQTANSLVYDESHNGLDKLTHELKLHDLRETRSQKCFSIVNRGQMWYNRLTESQKQELQDWYEAWLNVTDTLVEPETPEWLLSPEEQDSELEPVQHE